MMGYKYITCDNLADTQDYMYSEYLGQKFIEQYFESRYIYTKNNSMDVQTAMHKMLETCSSCSECFTMLRNLYSQISEKNTALPLQQICLFQKRFEVKKRLYSSYKTSTSIGNSGEEYRDLNPYLLLSAILLETYRRTNSLSCFSTYLKINDTLISCCNAMTQEQQNVLEALICNEVALVKKLLKEKWGSTRGMRYDFA